MSYQDISHLIDLLDQAIDPEAHNSLQSGGIIASGYNVKVDEYRDRIRTSKDWLAGYQADLIAVTQISNLKIKYTGAAGYFIEISKNHISKVWDDFVHKQTLVNASRFITPTLKDFESKLLEAEAELASLEYELFQELRLQVLEQFEPIKQLSQTTAYIDFCVAGSEVGNRYNYVRPLLHKGYDMNVSGWRHPVIERIEGDFIRNDLELTKKSFVHIITGPNMWGKSTFLRQNALIVLMAHMWFWVPASQARIPLTDKIFSRVGASDNLYKWQSTFMVEMQEVAHILKHSSSRSFVIIDEVWRWTSTYDGMSLAWAILKHNHDKIQAKTLFATHYHELVDESVALKWVKNFCVSVWENQGKLIFLRKIIEGGMKRSYGLEVAKLAGISSEVIAEARSMIKVLEQEHSQMSMGFNTSIPSKQDSPQPPLLKGEQVISELEKQLADLDVDSLTPMEALNLIHSWKNTHK